MTKVAKTMGLVGQAPTMLRVLGSAGVLRLYPPGKLARLGATLARWSSSNLSAPLGVPGPCGQESFHLHITKDPGCHCGTRGPQGLVSPLSTGATAGFLHPRPALNRFLRGSLIRDRAPPPNSMGLRHPRGTTWPLRAIQ